MVILDNMSEQEIRDFADEITNNLVREDVIRDFDSTECYKLIYNYLHRKVINE